MTARTEARVGPFTAQEALVCAMVLMSVADGPMSDAELAMMSRLVQELPAFSDFHSNEIETVTDSVAGLIGDDDGLDRALSLIREALPMRLRETAYLLACEVCAADGDATQEELLFLQDLRIGLDIDRLIAGAIERAAKARYQVI
jgi:tellurite resistance protein